MQPTKIKDSEFYAVMLPKGLSRPISKTIRFIKEGVEKPPCFMPVFSSDQWDEYLITDKIEKEDGIVLILLPIPEEEKMNSAIVPENLKT